MDIEICTVSGYKDIGKNMTAIRVGEEVVLVDMGLHIENYVKYTEDDDFVHVEPSELMVQGAAPDISHIEDWRAKVVAIVPSHAHLDHVGAVPYLAPYFKAPVMGTPFTIEIIRNILRSEKIQLPNRLQDIGVNGKTKAGSLGIELVNMTHSTPQTSAVVVHTPKGAVIYMCDFKLDETPTLGQVSNLKRLKELGEQGVLALILDSTNAQKPGRTPSEKVAQEMLADVLRDVHGRDTGIIVTTFSSHLARLQATLEQAQKMGRKVMFLGRSMGRYIEAGEAAGIIKFTNRAESYRFGSKIARALKKVEKEGKGKYLLVVSGHQGEPKSTLSKMSAGLLHYKFDPRDYVIFSCKVIPTETNRRNRDNMERAMIKQGVNIYKDIHQSGHAAAEDVKDVLRLLKPKHLIPAHGNEDMKGAMASLAKECDIEHIHVLQEGDRVKID